MTHYPRRLRNMPVALAPSSLTSSDESDVEQAKSPQHYTPASKWTPSLHHTDSKSSYDSPTVWSSSTSSLSSISPLKKRRSLKKKERNVPKRSLVITLYALGSLWFTFMCFLVWQFHGIHSDPIAFWEHYRTSPREPFLSPSSRVTIPLPLPKVSVVLINYSRPRMIQESILMRTLLAHSSIDEILLLHANPKTAFEFVHPKVINIDATQHNDQMGLSLRFYFCQLAKNDWVIHVDDDMEFTTSTLNELLIEYSRNPKRIVGRFGRDLQLGNSFQGYSSSGTHEETEVVLTKLMVMERNICSNFFDFAHLVWDDVVLYSGEGPLWNGEDIFMSLVANHVYGTPADGRKYNNYAMDWLDVWQASESLKDYDNGKLDISGGMKGLRLWDWQWWQSVLRRNRHYSFRGQLWQTAKQRLAELGDRR